MVRIQPDVQCAQVVVRLCEHAGTDDAVVFVLARDNGRRPLARRLRQQPPHRVVPELADERALRPCDHPVRPVTLDVGDDLAVQVDLVQVARAVVQVVQDAAIRQRRLHANTQLKRIICPLQPQPHRD